MSCNVTIERSKSYMRKTEDKTENIQSNKKRDVKQNEKKY